MARAPTIDTHAHYFPQSYLDLIAKRGPRVGSRVEQDAQGRTFIQVGLLLRTGPIAREFIDHEARLKEMDRQGVRVHVLSLTQPMVYWADDDLGLELSIAFNDACSAAHRAHPERLFGFAAAQARSGVGCANRAPAGGRSAHPTNLQPARGGPGGPI